MQHFNTARYSGRRLIPVHRGSKTYSCIYSGRMKDDSHALCFHWLLFYFPQKTLGASTVAGKKDKGGCPTEDQTHICTDGVIWTDKRAH